MKTYKIYQVDSFTQEKFKGNPAGVVLNADGLTEEQMQMIAGELNNSETAFILSPEGDDHEVRIRFFTPKTEVPSCGHATIAAHFIRAHENLSKSGRIFHKIGIGVLPIDIEKFEDTYKVYMTQAEPEFGDSLDINIEHRILTALGLEHLELEEDCPIQIVNTGNSKVIIAIKTREKLNSLNPNMIELTEISKQIECNGYFVFTFDSGNDNILTRGRMFAPAIGIAEDPVTGNANGPLGAYLVKNKIVKSDNDVFSFIGAQGEAIGREGKVEVEVIIENGNPKIVRIGGHAVKVFETEITL